ncbi:MAG: hypothetical protein EA374_03265 [Acholeplasmatales bacterium]|nr:MAG: hypothetical protein EA374_03265 [Acholeplasmatales bacterium]
MHDSRLKKRHDQRRRYRVFDHLMTTFAVTVVVVVTVVLTVPARLSGSIEYLEVVDDTLYFQVRLDDPEARLVSDSLYLRIDHPLDRRDIPLQAGVYAGHIDALRPSSRYKVTLHASQGYGEEILGRATIDTAVQEVGTIAGVFFTEDFSMGMWLIEAVILKAHLSEYDSMFVEVTWSDADGFTESYTAMITDGYNRVIVQTVSLWFKGVMEVHLIGIHPEAGEERIDVWTGRIPYAVYASVYLEDVGTNTMTMAVYRDDDLPDALYTLRLYQASRLIEQKRLSFVAVEDMYQMGTHRFRSLNPDTDYTVELWIAYKDPYTGEAKHRRVFSETHRTLALHQVDVYVEHMESGHRVRVVTDDPNQVLRNLRVLLYEVVEPYDLFKGSFTAEAPIVLEDGRIEHRFLIPPQQAEILLFQVIADYAVDGVIMYYFNIIDAIYYHD